MKTLGMISACLMLLSACTSQKDLQTYQLWYDKPAGEWTEALPVGNGRLGAMVFGDPIHERIQFNEESLWAGCQVDNNNPKALENLPALQQLIFEGKYTEALSLANEAFIGTPPNVRSHQTFGDLLITYTDQGNVDQYTRELTLNNGIARSAFDRNGIHIVQEVFTSAPDNVIVIRIAGSDPFSLTLELTRAKDAKTTYSETGDIRMIGQIIDSAQLNRGPEGAHMKFAALARVEYEGGSLVPSDEGLDCHEVRNLTVYLTAATTYLIEKLDFDNSIDPVVRCEEILATIPSGSYEQVKNDHIADHTALFNRVSFSLGDDHRLNIPTNQRLDSIKAGITDNGLITTYFQFGRYLLMGSSRSPGVLPANLQGLWNEHFDAPWNADFHTNINLQMNYWPAEVCNLSETSLVLTGFMEKLMKPGQVTASSMYGADGWTLHHLTDPFGRTGVADGVWGITPLDGPWMTFPVYRHFEFTKDLTYLRQIYPLLKGSVQFVQDFLIESPEGYLVSNPSHSPENAFFVPGSNQSERSALTYAATTDIQIINGLFDIFIEAATILDKDQELVTEIKEIQSLLPPVVIGENGTIQEWIQDYEEVEVGHRHMSHLLGLYPLSQISELTPELYQAARKTIDRRLESGGGHTGWSRAWIVNFFARLQDGEQAWNHLQQLLAKSTKNNLFDNHPPFQIDGNFGGTAGIAEMLLQSHNGTIHLLPALPLAWPEGHITGLRARGGFTCDLWWKNGKLNRAVVQADRDSEVRLRYQGEIKSLTLKAGQEFSYQPL